MSRDGINPNPAKLDKIRQWPKPEKGTGLASVFGLYNYYRDLIPSFAHMSEAFYKVCRADEVPWRKDLELKFDELKQQLLHPRIVRLPDPERHFILETDGNRVESEQSSNSASMIRASSTQWASSRGPSPAQSATTLHMKSNSTQWCALSNTRLFLLCREFFLQTDHAALRNLLRRNLPTTTRVKRWILHLSEYNFKIEYQRPGQHHRRCSLVCPRKCRKRLETNCPRRCPSRCQTHRVRGRSPESPRQTIYHSIHSKVNSKIPTIGQNLSASEDSDSDFDLVLPDGEIDSNFNYLDEVPEDLPLRSFQCEARALWPVLWPVAATAAACALRPVLRPVRRPVLQQFLRCGLCCGLRDVAVLRPVAATAVACALWPVLRPVL